MRCTSKERDYCNVEKMGCNGCYYDDKNYQEISRDEVINGLESLIDDRLSFLGPDDYYDKDNIFLHDVKILRNAIGLIQSQKGE